MKLYYFRSKEGNFGDDLNAWLWERLLPGVLDGDERTMLCGIGTLIGNNMSKESNWVIFGSGAGYLPVPDDFGSSRWNILCVRGPLSAEILGISREKAITDGAMLLATLPEYAPMPESERRGVVFMPHHGSKKVGKWKEACHMAGIEFVDPEADDRKTLTRLRSAKLVIADAMHAAIVADTLRVPWVPVAASLNINSFKWMDWTQSMNLPYKPTRLPASSRLEGFRSWFMPLRGQNFFLEGRSTEEVVRHFKKMQAIKLKKWWPYYSKFTAVIYHACRILLALYEYIMEFKTKDGRGQQLKRDPYILRAAHALRQAVDSQSYLSADDVFADRKRRMSECVEQAKRLKP